MKKYTFRLSDAYHSSVLSETDPLYLQKMKKMKKLKAKQLKNNRKINSLANMMGQQKEDPNLKSDLTDQHHTIPTDNDQELPIETSDVVDHVNDLETAAL